MKWDILNQGTAVKTLLRAKPKGFLPLIANGKTPSGKGFLKSPKKLSDLVIADRVELSFMVDNAGIVPGGRILILDIDGPNHLRADGVSSGVDGFASLAMWEKKFGDIPAETLAAETPSGGIQRYYLLPESRWGTVAGDSNLGAGELGLKETGLDVRSGDGCYAVLPGSTVPQGVYRWRDPACPILPAPDSLLKLVKSTGKPKKPKADTPERVCDDRTEEENRAMLEDVLSHIKEPDYTTWEVIGAALASEGFDKDVYVEWDRTNGAPSALDGPYSAEAKWETFLHGVVPEGGAGIGTIFFYARKYDPNFRVPLIFRRGEIMDREQIIAELMDDDEDGNADQDQTDSPDSAPPAAPPGHGTWKGERRFEKLERYAGKLLTNGMDEAKCWAEVMKANAEHCSPPLTDEELEALHGQVRRWKYLAPQKDRISGYLARIPDYDLFRDGQSASEMGWARLLAGMLSSAEYLTDLKSWAMFDGRIWQVNALSDAKIASFLCDFTDAMFDRAKAIKGDEDRQQALKSVARLTRHSFRAGIEKTLESLLAGTSEDFDGVEYDQMLAVENGLLDLSDIAGKGVRLLPFDPSHRITKMCGASFDPTAEAPEFEKAVSQILVRQRRRESDPYETDEDLVKTFQMWCGCGLEGGMNLAKIALWHGETTRNGKSTLSAVLSHVLGGYSTSLSPKSLLKTGRESSGSAPSPDVMGTYRKRCVIASEPDQGSVFSSDMLKRMSGGDDIQGRALYSNSERKEKLYLRLNVLCNSLPRCDDSSLIRSDRIVVFPFYRHFEEGERDTDLPRKLVQESSGVLNWLLQGLREYHGAVGAKVVPFGTDAAPSVVAATEEYALSNDQIKRFLAERCERAEGSRTPVENIFTAYQTWVPGTGFRQWGQGAFTAGLREHGVYVQRARPAKGQNAVQCAFDLRLMPQSRQAAAYDKLMAVAGDEEEMQA